jgi:hypothetical protein
VTQSAEQTQTGGGGQTQIVEQSTESGTCEQSSTPAAAAWVTGQAHPAGWVLVAGTSFSLSLAHRARAWSQGTRAAAPSPRRAASVSFVPAPRAPHAPLPPQTPAALGAAAGGSAGGSLWVFGLTLLPFFLTAPWWARRERLSVIRRLMGVVSRPERPG